MKRFLTWAVLFIACCISTSAWAATVGRIDGTLTDAQTKEPLVGVTVSVVGTGVGGFSDADGKYSIINVSAGTYMLRISSVGYETVEVEGLSVSANHSTLHDQAMTATATELGKVIKVTAENPMILRD